MELGRPKLLTGDIKNAELLLSWPETRMGLTGIWPEILTTPICIPAPSRLNASAARCKISWRDCLAYVGRNEMVEKFERTQKSLEKARKGDAAALAQIMDHAGMVRSAGKSCVSFTTRIGKTAR